MHFVKNNVVPLVLGDYLNIGEMGKKRDGNSPSMKRSTPPRLRTWLSPTIQRATRGHHMDQWAHQRLKLPRHVPCMEDGSEGPHASHLDKAQQRPWPPSIGRTDLWSAHPSLPCVGPPLVHCCIPERFGDIWCPRTPWSLSINRRGGAPFLHTHT
jgi:hypothetical protein